MYPLVFFVTCFNLLYVLLLDTFLKCLILHRNAPHWRVCTDLKWRKQIKVIFKNVKTRMIHVSIEFYTRFRDDRLVQTPIGTLYPRWRFVDGNISLCRLFGLYSLKWMGLLQFYTIIWALWRVTGPVVADSSGKDVSVVMWRSLLLTMTVIPLSALNVLLPQFLLLCALWS